MSPTTTPSGSSTPSSSSSGGSGGLGGSGSPVIAWPEGIGSVGNLLGDASSQATRLRAGLDAINNLPYVMGKDKGDGVTGPFLELLLSTQQGTDQLMDFLSKVLGLNGDTTLQTDNQHTAAETVNTALANRIL